MQPLLCDTRQQRGKHNFKNQYFKRYGIPIIAVALKFGDYQRKGSNIAIDTKKDVQELAQNLGKDHKRFKREIIKANEAGYVLVVLIEERPEYNDRRRLSSWTNYVCKRCGLCDDDKCRRFRYHPIKGETIAKIITTLENKHFVRFEFTNKRETPKRILELLGMEVRDGLKSTSGS